MSNIVLPCIEESYMILILIIQPCVCFTIALFQRNKTKCLLRVVISASDVLAALINMTKHFLVYRDITVYCQQDKINSSSSAYLLCHSMPFILSAARVLAAEDCALED